MKKRRHQRPAKKFTAMDFLKGSFLNKEEVKQHYKYILFCFVLLMIMIYTNDLVNQKIGQVNILKNQVEEYKSQNAYTQSKLIKIKLESHPLKIIVKMDSADYERDKR